MKITPYKLVNFASVQFLNRVHKITFIPKSFVCFLENVCSSILGKKVHFEYEKKSKTFIATEREKRRYFSNAERGFWLYRNGIEARSNFIFQSYCLQNLTFRSGDVIVDCGANSGDLSMKIYDMCESIEYIGIEPSPRDYEMLTKNINNQNSHLLQKALGNTNDSLKFYICSEKGDSSLVEPPSYSNVIDVDVVTLESLLDSLNIEKVKLIKIEAEGFEPEILEGAQSILRNVEYIAVDGGYERGKDCEQTLTTATNFLVQNNFEMVDIYFPWYRALFRNKSFLQDE